MKARTRKRASRLILVLLLLAVTAQGQERKTYTVPFTRIHGWLVIHAKVNDKDGLFIVDTGSDRTVASPKFVNVQQEGKALEIQKAGGKITALSIRAVVSVAGKNINLPVLVYDTREISDTAGQPLDGIIGLDVLSLYDSIEIDFRAKVLRFQ